MTQKEYDDLNRLISATLDNTAKLDNKIDRHSDMLGKIYTDLGMILKNQKILLDYMSANFSKFNASTSKQYNSQGQDKGITE